MIRSTALALLVFGFAAFFTTLSSEGLAQSKLAPCPTDQNQIYGNCFGTYIWANGDKYVGEWKDGKRNGQGTYTFSNGNKYVGEFKHDFYEGKGTLYAANGSVLQSGLWENDNLVTSGPDEQVVVDGGNCDQAYIRANAIFIRATANYCTKDYMDSPAGYFALEKSSACQSLGEAVLVSKAKDAMTELDREASKLGKSAVCKWVDQIEESVNQSAAAEKLQATNARPDERLEGIIGQLRSATGQVQGNLSTQDLARLGVVVGSYMTMSSDMLAVKEELDQCYSRAYDTGNMSSIMVCYIADAHLVRTMTGAAKMDGGENIKRAADTLKKAQELRFTETLARAGIGEEVQSMTRAEFNDAWQMAEDWLATRTLRQVSDCIDGGIGTSACPTSEPTTGNLSSREVPPGPAGFVCPDELPSDVARADEIVSFIKWYSLEHKNPTSEQIMAERKSVLEYYHCTKTLENIDRSASSAAQPETLGDVRGWTITYDGSDGGACYASAGYVSGTTLTVGKQGPNASWVMQFVNPKWSSIEVGSQYDASFIFNGRSTWTGSNTGVENGIRSESLKDEFIAAFARSSSLELRVNDKRVDGFDLTGTRAASDAVAQCYKDRVETADPFASTSEDPFASTSSDQSSSQKPDATAAADAAFVPKVKIRNDGTVELTRTGFTLTASQKLDLRTLTDDLTKQGYRVEVGVQEAEGSVTVVAIKDEDSTILAIVLNVDTGAMEYIQSVDPVWEDAAGIRFGTSAREAAASGPFQCEHGDSYSCGPSRPDHVGYDIDPCGVDDLGKLDDGFDLSSLADTCTSIERFWIVPPRSAFPSTTTAAEGAVGK